MLTEALSLPLRNTPLASMTHFEASLIHTFVAEAALGVEVPRHDPSQLGIPADDLASGQCGLAVFGDRVGVLDEVSLRHPLETDPQGPVFASSVQSPMSHSRSFR